MDKDDLQLYLDNGWIKGSYKKGKSSKWTTKGMHWYTNGEKDILCLPENCPDGFYLRKNNKDHERR